MPKPVFFLALVVAGASASAANVVADPPKHCDACAEWNEPLKPFKVYGNTWYVGTAGLGAILVTSPQGHILIDGGLPQSAPLIADNIVAAGFKLTDVKLLLNSHAHYDHAGGLAALQRVTGARVAASPASQLALEGGGPREDDPQFAFGHEHNDYARVRDVTAIKDGETLKVGPLSITALFTPGHTPGGTSWIWESCEGSKCVKVAYVDSLNAVSAPGFRFTDDAALLRKLEKSISAVETLRCDVLLAPHGGLFQLEEKLVLRQKSPETNPFVERFGCEVYAANARVRLNERIAEERAKP